VRLDKGAEGIDGHINRAESTRLDRRPMFQQGALTTPMCGEDKRRGSQEFLPLLRPISSIPCSSVIAPSRHCLTKRLRHSPGSNTHLLPIMCRRNSGDAQLSLFRVLLTTSFRRPLRCQSASKTVKPSYLLRSPASVRQSGYWTAYEDSRAAQHAHVDLLQRVRRPQHAASGVTVTGVPESRDAGRHLQW
jgi:hypothetical protein